MRTSQVVFKGDDFALKSARDQLREEFRKSQSVTDPEALADLVRGIDEVDEMLRFNIVQGTKNERGNYDVNMREEHGVVMQERKDEPLGADFRPIDRGFAGDLSDVKMEKVKGKKKKDRPEFQPVE